MARILLQCRRRIFEEPNWHAEAMATPLSKAAAELALEASSQSAPADEECAESELTSFGNKQALYYGFGKTPDYGAALQCAYWHPAHPATGGFLDGAGTLTMLKDRCLTVAALVRQ